MLISFFVVILVSNSLTMLGQPSPRFHVLRLRFIINGGIKLNGGGGASRILKSY